MIVDVTRANQQAPQFPEDEDDIFLLEGTELNTTVRIIEAEDGDSKPLVNLCLLGPDFSKILK